MLTYTKVKAYKCIICMNKFSMKGSLADHFRIHLGEKPYGCAECRTWYTDCSSRNYHISSCYKELSKKQQSELKCKIQKSIVYDYLEFDEN